MTDFRNDFRSPEPKRFRHREAPDPRRGDDSCALLLGPSREGLETAATNAQTGAKQTAPAGVHTTPVGDVLHVETHRSRDPGTRGLP